MDQSSDNSLVNAPNVDGLVILELIGRGASSLVYKARQILMDRIVALKVMKLESLSPTSLNRFRNEAKICSTLDHPGMARVLSFGLADDGKSPYMIMEYCVGKTLAEYLHSDEHFSGHQISSLVLLILDVLSYAHSHKIVHRDLKPENIIIQKNEQGGLQIKLLDFGIARLLESDDISAGSNSRTMLGSPAYMSPEQCAGKPADERSDIYALGCILYEMLFGRPLFEASNSLELLYKKSNEDAAIDRSERIQAQLGKSMLDLLESSLCRDPALRPQNTDEFRQRFIKAMGNMQAISSKSLSELLSSPEPAQRSITPFFILILVLAILTITLIFAFHPKTAPSPASIGLATHSHNPVASLSVAHDLEEGERMLKASNYSKAVKTLQAALEKARSPQERVKVLNLLARASSGSSTSMEEDYLIEAENIALKSHLDPEPTGRTFALHAHILRNKGGPETERLLKQAASFLRKPEVPQQYLSDTLSELADCLELEEKYTEVAGVLVEKQQIQTSLRGPYAETAINPRLQAISCREHGKPRVIEKQIMKVVSEIEKQPGLSNDQRVADLASCARYLLRNPGSLSQAVEVLKQARALINVATASKNGNLYKQTIIAAARAGDETLFKDSVKSLFLIKDSATSFAMNNIYHELESSAPQQARYVIEAGLDKWDPATPDSTIPCVEAMTKLAELDLADKKQTEAEKLYQRIIDVCEQKGASNLRLYIEAKAKLAELKKHRQ